MHNALCEVWCCTSVHCRFTQFTGPINHKLFATFNIHKTRRCWHDVCSGNWHGLSWDEWAFYCMPTLTSAGMMSASKKNSVALWKNILPTSLPKWRVVRSWWDIINLVRASAIPPICSSGIRSFFCVNAKPLTALSKCHYFLTAGGSTGLLRALLWPSWGCSL